MNTTKMSSKFVIKSVVLCFWVNTNLFIFLKKCETDYRTMESSKPDVYWQPHESLRYNGLSIICARFWLSLKIIQTIIIIIIKRIRRSDEIVKKTPSRMFKNLIDDLDKETIVWRTSSQELVPTTSADYFHHFFFVIADSYEIERVHTWIFVYVWSARVSLFFVSISKNSKKKIHNQLN